jgi:hypothetical protein
MKPPQTVLAAALAFILVHASVPSIPAAERHEDKRFGELVDNAALVYLIRQKKFQGKARTIFVFSEETLLGTLDNNSYTFTYVPPGEHLFWLNFAKTSERVDLDAGEAYYFNVSPRGAWRSKLVIENIGSEWGEALINEVKSFCTPTSKEIAKADEYVTERLGKAEKYAAKESESRYYSREKTVGRWPKADLAPYSILFIEDFTLTDPNQEKRKKQMQVQTAGSRVADMLERELRDGLFSEVRRDSAAGPVEGAVVLRAELTQYKPGSRAARGFLIGTSNAHLDFIVHLIDGATGAELATFSDDRIWILSDAGGVGIEEMEESLAFELSVYLTECKTGVEWQPE